MDKQELLRKYLDEELSPAEEQKALHIIADDNELRSALRFDLFLRQSITEQDFSKKTFHVPEGFSERVMMQIDQQSKEEASESILSQLNEKISAWLEVLFTPRSFQLKPAFAALLLMLALLLTAVPYYFTPTVDNNIVQNNDDFQTQSVAESEELAWVRFIYVDENAENIAIAGDFNDWQPYELTEQTVNGKDVWTGFFAMPRGENKYMFVVNGENWVTDPLANMYEDDGFGNKNAIIYL